MPRSGRLPQPFLDQPPDIRGDKEIQGHLAASLVGEGTPDLKPVFTSPCLPPHLLPQGFLLAFPVWAAFEDFRVWILQAHH